MQLRTTPRGRGRVVVGATAGLLAVLLAWSPVLAAVSWGTVYKSSTDYAYTWGNALARTVTSGGTAYLHSVFTRDRIGGDPVQDDGPYLGVYYRRGNSTGSSWGTTKRLNASTQHGDMGVVATSSRYVYVAWRQQIHYGSSYSSNDQRQLRFVRNTSHGSSTSWSPRKSFLGAYYIDRPSISATGSRVYIAYTDTVGGEIRVQRSTDYGANFTLLEAVGATTALGSDGYSGAPVVAASGNLVAVVWDNGSSAWMKLSTDGGTTWSVSQEFEPSRVGRMSGAARGSRLAFAWVDAANRKVYMRMWNGSSLASRRTVASFSDSTSYKIANAPSVGLAGNSTVGVAYSACNTTSCSLGSTKGSSIRWRQSSNNGSTWAATQTIGSYTASSTRRLNEFPSVLFVSLSTRFVAWTAGGASSGSLYRVVIRRGTGTP